MSLFLPGLSETKPLLKGQLNVEHKKFKKHGPERSAGPVRTVAQLSKGETAGKAVCRSFEHIKAGTKLSNSSDVEQVLIYKPFFLCR